MFIGRTDVEAETPVFGHLMRRADSFEKTLMLGKIEGRRRIGCQRDEMDGCITNAKDMNLGKLWELVSDGEAWSAVVNIGVHVSFQTWFSLDICPGERSLDHQFNSVQFISVAQPCLTL